MDDSEPDGLNVLFDDNVIPERITFNISDKEAKGFGGLLSAVVTLDLMATGFVLWITYVTTAMDGMKRCEKLLVYNVLLPDLLLEFILIYFIAPATFAMYWHQGIKDTMWLAFFHTFCIFHPHIASATICYVVALSKTDAYMYEMANDMKHMTIVTMSTVAVSICLCSLPATEDKGYGFQQNWLCPSFNTHHQYGSSFMCAGILGLVAYVDIICVYKLLEAKRFYQENLSRTTKKAFEDLEKEMVYCIISMVTACLVIPAALGMPDSFLMFLPRLLVYASPGIRVFMLLNYCPHFQFAYFGQEDVEDYATLEGLDQQMLALAENPATTSAAPAPVMLEPNVAVAGPAAPVGEESTRGAAPIGTEI